MPSKVKLKPFLAAGLLVFAAGGPSWAQQDADTVEKTEAIAAVKAMGEHLRSLKRFTLAADTTRDDITESGQNVEMASHLELKAAPDRFRIDATSDSQTREYFYDGKTVTVFAPVIGAYAEFDGGATTRETLEIASAGYGLKLPLADLFFWGTNQDDLDALTDGFPIGTSTIGGNVCAHYAFRQEEVDWQIWIRTEAQPLPCKLVITTTSEESRPRYEATLTWDLDAPVDDSDFVFDPPDDAYEIGIEPVADTAQ